MKVCDRCREELNTTYEAKLLGKIFDLCEECAKKTENYILLSGREKKGFLGEILKMLNKIEK